MQKFLASRTKPFKQQLLFRRVDRLASDPLFELVAGLELFSRSKTGTRDDLIGQKCCPMFDVNDDVTKK